MKNNNKIKMIALSLMAVLSIGSFTACSTQDSNSSDKNDSPNTSVSDSDTDTKDTDNNSDGTENKDESGKESDTAQKNDSTNNGEIPELSDPTPDDMGETINGILVYNRVAYELFGGGESLAKDYAKSISDIKNHFGDSIKVYNVVVPTHCGVTLPEKFSDRVSSQEDYLNTICSSYSADIVGVNTYDTIMHHRDEYLYFNTDHHWTGRAAYYAYEDFCKAAGIDAISLDKMKSSKIEGYYGSLANDIGDSSLLDEDYVEYFTVDYDIDTTVYDSNAENPQDSMLIHDYAEGANSYGVFLGGDQPLMVTKNKNGNGKKIAVIKESYGNAFAPFIAYTYSEAHIMDFRDIDFDLKQYLIDNEIDKVIFVNNAMASATPERVEELEALAQ